MELADAILRIAALKQQWDEAQPLKQADNDRLWKKLRLEWNYNSNHIEGNTLTYGETELLLIFGQTTGDHTIREYEEMKAHDAAIQHVREMATESRAINEADIRSLNQLILKEPFWKPAITPGGHETRKQIIPGEYKTTPNNVRTATGEVFQFANPIETPARMHQLIEWLQASLADPSADIPRVIARLHYDFIIIHPFDDGNGRVARLLVNYVLIRFGYPPIVIKSRDKRNYLAALNRADTGDFDAFVHYLTNEVVWSLELGVRASQGKSVEEPDDLDKEIAMFLRQQSSSAVKPPAKSPVTLRMAAEHSWIRLIECIGEKLKPLSVVFHSVVLIVCQVHRGGGSLTKYVPTKWTGEWDAENVEWKDILRTFGVLSKGRDFIPTHFDVTFTLQGYSGSAPPFTVDDSFRIETYQFEYGIVRNSSKSGGLKYRYDHILTDEELVKIANEVVGSVFEKIRNTTELSSN
jgi:Fic family protein